MSERDYYDKERHRFSPYDHGDQRERRDHRDNYANPRYPRDYRDSRENRDLRYSREDKYIRNSRDSWSPRRRSPPRDYNKGYPDDRRYKESGRERERRSPPPERSEYSSSRSYSNKSPPRPTSPSSRYDRVAPLLAQTKRPLTPQQQKIEEMDKQYYQMQSEERVTEDKIFDIERDIKNSYFALSQAKLAEDIAHAKLEEIRKRIQMLS